MIGCNNKIWFWIKEKYIGKIHITIFTFIYVRIILKISILEEDFAHNLSSKLLLYNNRCNKWCSQFNNSRWWWNQITICNNNSRWINHNISSNHSSKWFNNQVSNTQEDFKVTKYNQWWTNNNLWIKCNLDKWWISLCRRLNYIDF